MCCWSSLLPARYNKRMNASGCYNDIAFDRSEGRDIHQIEWNEEIFAAGEGTSEGFIEEYGHFRRRGEWESELRRRSEINREDEEVYHCWGLFGVSMVTYACGKLAARRGRHVNSIVTERGGLFQSYVSVKACTQKTGFQVCTVYKQVFIITFYICTSV